MTFLKKMPWGIVAGVAAIIVVFATVAFIALGIILGGVAGQTNEVAGMFDEWYQVLLFVVDVVCGVIMIGSIVLFIVLDVVLGVAALSLPVIVIINRAVTRKKSDRTVSVDQ